MNIVSRTCSWFGNSGLLAVIGIGAAAVAGPPVLVKDINRVDVSDSNPAHFIATANRVYFAADDGIHGRSLYVSDGTHGGTTMLLNRPVYGYPNGTSLDRYRDATFGAGLLFSCDDGVHGEELWYSDGTPLGTRLVMDLIPGPDGASGVPYRLRDSTAAAIVNGRALFRGKDSQGPGVFLTDGTEAGTALLLRLDPSAYFFGGPIAESWNDVIAFVGGESPNSSIWTTDGTPAGTRQIVSGTAACSIVGTLLGNGNLLYFTASDGATVWLWRTDGTPVGTVRLKPASGAQPTLPVNITVVKNKVLFGAGGPGSQIYDPADLWMTDGTAAGTVRLKSGGGIARPFFSAVGPGAMWSPASDHVVFAWGANELWRSDGTAAGTTQVSVLTAPGVTAQTFFGQNVRDGDRCYFAVAEGVSASGLFVTDGTVGGTGRVCDLLFEDLAESPFGPFFSPLVGAVGKDLLFVSGRDAELGTELWRTDGTEAGTVFVRDLLPGIVAGVPRASMFSPLVGGAFFFPGWSGKLGHELYSTDGSEAGTSLVSDINAVPVTDSSTPGSFVPLDDRFIFVAGVDPTHQQRDTHLFASDGTEDGTQPIAEAPSNGIASAVRNGNQLLFLWDSDGTQADLWVTDATEQGTLRVQGFDYADPSLFESMDQSLAVVSGGGVFGAFRNGRAGAWWSDGTADNAILLRETLSDFGEAMYCFTSVEYGAVFVDHASDGPELIFTDGTPAGTRPIGSFPVGARINTLRTPPQSRSCFVSVNGRAVFLVGEGFGAASLWSTDGTDDGTFLIATLPASDLAPTLAGTAGDHSVAYLAINYFSGTYGAGLVFRTDGTATGTSEIARFIPDAGGLQSEPTIQGMTWAGAQAVFYVRQFSPDFQAFFAVDELSGLREVSADLSPSFVGPYGADYYWHNSADEPMASLGPVAFFTGKKKSDQTDTSYGVCATNGTGSGTNMISPAINPGQMLVWKGSLILCASGDATGRELWRIDLCLTDVNSDGITDRADYDAFIAAFEAGIAVADFDGNSFVNGDDLDSFALAFEAGC